MPTDHGLGNLENTHRDPPFDDSVSGEMLSSDFLNTDEGWDDVDVAKPPPTEPPPRVHRHETDRSFPAPPPERPSPRSSTPESDPPTAIKPNEAEESDDELISTLVNSPGPDDPASPPTPSPGFSAPELVPAHVLEPAVAPEMAPSTASVGSLGGLPPEALATAPFPNPNIHATPQAAQAPASPPTELPGYVPRMRMPSAAGPSVKTVIAAGAGVGVLGTIALIAYFSMSGPSESTEAPTDATAAPATRSASTAASPPSTAKPDASAQANPKPSKKAPAKTGPEAEALAVLEKLRAGIPHCVKNVIHVLPGPSPAVPQLFATLKGGPYPSNWKDWDNPTWHCTEVKLKTPQRFQIQWQVVVPNREGVGVVWLDEDGDGEPDVELFFEAKLIERDVVDVGEIKRGKVTRKPIRVR